jgi:hypothetical protein
VLGPAGDVLPTPTVHPDHPSLTTLPARTNTDPVFGSRSDSVSESASLIRRPARHRIAISPRVRSAYGPGPAWRITRMISSTVGGSAG